MKDMNICVKIYSVMLLIKNTELDSCSLDNIQLLELDLMLMLPDWEFNFAFQHKRDIKDS